MLEVSDLVLELLANGSGKPVCCCFPIAQSAKYMATCKKLQMSAIVSNQCKTGAIISHVSR